ncbi:unnamed protein product [Diamesa hyperborea]
MPEADDGTVSTNVLLQIAQILVLRMPIGGMQIITSKWMKKFLISEDRKKVEEFLPLFILSLKQQTLVEPFESAPFNSDSKKWDKFPCDKQEFTQSDIKKSLKEDRLWEKNAPPYKIDISRDLMEYAAYQEIPNFGAHFYYAFSLEPLPKWQNFNKFRVPRKMIPSLTVEYADSTPDYDSSEELTTPESPATVSSSALMRSPSLISPPVSRKTPATRRTPAVKRTPAARRSLPFAKTPAVTKTPATKRTLASMKTPAAPKKTPVPKKSPVAKKTPVIIIDEPSSVAETEDTDVDDTQNQIIEDRVTETMRRIALASQSPMCKTRAQELKSKLDVIKTRKEQALLSPEVVIEPTAIEQLDIYQLPAEFLDASERIRSVTQMATTEMERLKINQTPDLVMSDFIVTATDQVGHQFLDAFHSTDYQLDFKSLAITAVEILDLTIDNRNRIQMAASPVIIVDSEVTRQLEDIRENIADTEQLIDDEFMDESGISEEENSANKSQILEHINEAIAICEEEQSLLDTSFPEDETSAKFISLLSNNNKENMETADEITDESGNSEEENSANLSQILEQINEAIAVCKEEQVLLETSIPEDETSVKFVSLLSNSNNSAIEELEDVINQSSDSITDVEIEVEEEDDTKKKPAKISCENCGKTFTRKYHLERHLLHTSCCPETKTKDHLSCEVCGKSFTRVDNLRMHLRAHLGVKSRTRTFECSYCEKSFYGSSLLNIHIRTHTGDKPFKCGWEGCDKAFPSSGAQTKHRRVHTGERPYECDICNNRFSAKETLNRHKKTHTGKRDHVCKICGKSFIQNTQLKSHMFHHTGENAFTCDHCGKQFNRKMRLTEHVSYVHQGKQPPTCGMCKKQFIRREDLNRHLEIHTGKRIHLCPFPDCGKNFVTKPAVKIHFRTHSKEDPSICSYCNRSFVRMDCLIRHMRTKHRNQLQDIITTEPKSKLPRKAKSKVTKKEESDDEDAGAPIFLNDDELKKRISELLSIVIEESILTDLGFGIKSVDEVLCSVIEQCSRQPLTKDSHEDDSTRMRENTKSLFSLVLDDEHIKSLLNNYTVDEVLTIVLKMSK